MVVANNQIKDNKTYTSNAGDFDPHVDAVVQCGVHCPMARILGFTRSHWMTPSGKCLRCIALAAATWSTNSLKTQNTNKNYFQLANSG